MIKLLEQFRVVSLLSFTFAYTIIVVHCSLFCK